MSITHIQEFYTLETFANVTVTQMSCHKHVHALLRFLLYKRLVFKWSSVETTFYLSKDEKQEGQKELSCLG